MSNLVMDDIAKIMGQTVYRLFKENDYEMPVTAACVPASGLAFILKISWEDPVNPEAGFVFEAIRVEGEPVVTPPINILYVDATGLRSKHFILNEEGGEWIH